MEPANETTHTVRMSVIG